MLPAPRLQRVAGFRIFWHRTKLERVSGEVSVYPKLSLVRQTYILVLAARFVLRGSYDSPHLFKIRQR